MAGFATGLVLGAVSWRRHKSVSVLIISGLSTAVFVAALVTVGSLFRFDELEQKKIQQFHLKRIGTDNNKYIEAKPYWMENTL